MAILDLTSGGSPTYVLGVDHPSFEAGSATSDQTGALIAEIEAASGLTVVATCESARAALDLAVKLARDLTGRAGVTACRGAPVEPGTRLISHGDALQAGQVFSKELPAAFVIEVVQASSNASPPPPKYFQRVRESADEFGVKLVIDETSCGLGRCESLLAFRREKFAPDFVALSLRVAPGVDGGLVLARTSEGVKANIGEVAAARTALAVLEVIARDQLVESSRELGKLLQKLVQEIIETRRLWAMDCRGRGLLWALTLRDDPQLVVRSARERGLELGVTGKTSLLLAPPLTATESALRATVELLDDVLADL